MGDVGNRDKAHIIFLKSLKSGRQKPKSQISFPSSVISLPSLPSLPSTGARGQGLKVIWDFGLVYGLASQKVNQGR